MHPIFDHIRAEAQEMPIAQLKSMLASELLDVKNGNFVCDDDRAASVAIMAIIVSEILDRLNLATALLELAAIALDNKVEANLN